MRFRWSEIVEGLNIASGALKSNRMRSVLTTLGIVIGIIVVTVIISVIQGLNKFVGSEISGLGADTIYITRMPWMIQSYEDYMEFQKRKRITDEEFREMSKQVTLAKAVAPTIYTRKVIKYKSKSVDRVLVAGSNDQYMETSNVLPETGRFFSSMETDLRRNVCVIGLDVVEEIFEDEFPVGKRIKIGSHPFLVIGVLEERGELFGESMDNLVVVPYTGFQKYFGSRRSIDIQVKAANPTLLNNLKDELEGVMRRVRGLGVDDENDFSINEQSQLMDMYRNMTSVLWVVLIGIGSIALLVGGIGIMNIMLVSVTERTHEIGIRKSLGAKRRVIMWQFLVESILISSIGVTIGIIISMGIGFLIREVSPIPVNISSSIILLGIIFTVAIGVFFGLYPASKAARLDPIVALRTE
jgi:putative ABC transport system permease protein